MSKKSKNMSKEDAEDKSFKKDLSAFVKEIARREGKKSQIKVGDIREVLRIMAEMYWQKGHMTTFSTYCHRKGKEIFGKDVFISVRLSAQSSLNQEEFFKVSDAYFAKKYPKKVK